MLERYIEHNILRQVYLCEQLYDFSKIDIDNSAKLLNVSTPTILSDLESIIESLEYCIESYNKDKHCFIIIFKEDITLSELTQFLYGQSYVLRFLSYYFKGIFASTTLSDLEYISLSKVYKTKKIVLDFFKENNYLKDKKIIIPEFDSRNILLALVRYINWDGYNSKNSNVKRAILELIEYVEINFFNRRYSQEEKFFIFRGIEIALGRKKYPLNFNNTEKNQIRHKPLFILISQGLSQQIKFLNIQENDIYYIFSLFNTRNYTNQNMELLKKDVEVVYENFVVNNVYYKELISLITNQQSVMNIDNFILKRAFLQFVRTLWADGQVFLPEKIYLLSKHEEILYKNILNILETWKKKNKITIRWNHNLIRKFIKEIILTFDYCKESNISEVFIVAESAIKQVFYREQISIYIKDDIKVNSRIYHSLKELPDECFYVNKRIVLCDMTVYHNGLNTNKTVIFPISLSNIDIQMYHLKKFISVKKNSL